VNLSTVLQCTLANKGLNDEYNIPVIAWINEPFGQIFYRDTIIIPFLKHGLWIDTFFKEFTLPRVGNSAITVVVVLSTDERSLDDTLYSLIKGRYELDAQVLAIPFPKPTSQIRERTAFRPVGRFSNTSYADAFSVPVRVEIRRCTDNVLVYRADSTISELLTEEPPVDLPFPEKWGKYDTRSLAPGCYSVAVIARLGTDGDRRNDTVYSTFNVVPYTYTDDIGVSVLSLTDPNKLFRIEETVPIRVRVSNFGSNNEETIRVYASIKDRRGKKIYFDTLAISSLLKKENKEIDFKNFEALEPGVYTFYSHVVSDADGYSDNDSVITSFTVGPANDVQVVQILDPHNDEVKPIESEFEPRAVFRFSGISDKIGKVPVRVEIIRLPDSALAFHADGTIEELTYYAGLTEFSFPNQIPDTSIRNLPPGHYLMKVMALVSTDDVHLNDTAKVEFYVRAYDDVTGDTILSPGNRSNYEYSPIPIKARFSNVGFKEVISATAIAFIRDTVGTIVYQDTLHPADWKAGQALELRFKDFYPLVKGYYTLYCISALEQDYYPMGDTLKSQFFYGLPSLDIKAIAVLEPKPDTTLPSYTYFIPQGAFQWNGGYSDTTLDSFSARIELVQSDSIAFEASGSSFDLRKGKGDVAVWIYHTQPPYTSVDQLEDGYYRLVLIANASDDEDRSNDTVTSYFWIGDKASVKAALVEPSFMLDQNYPNPFADKTTIGYDLSEDGYAGLRVYDITGRVVMDYPKILQREGGHSIVLDFHNLPRGFYTYEINITTFLGTSYKLHKQLLHY